MSYNAPAPGPWKALHQIPPDGLYKVDIATPSAMVSKVLPADAVIHLMMDTQPESPWQGRAPWQSSPTDRTGNAAELERSIGDESHIYAGRVWIAPDAATQAQVDAMGRTIALLKGGGQVVSETTAQGFGQGALAAPPASKDWKAEHTGPAHPQANVLMRDSLENAIAGRVWGCTGVPEQASNGACLWLLSKRLAFLDRTLPLGIVS